MHSVREVRANERNATMLRLACVTLALALFAGTARADFAIDLDFAAKPMKDVRTSTCGPEMGYAGCAMEMGPGRGDTYFFETHGEDTARAMKEAGAWFQRMWSANSWFAKRNQQGKDGKMQSNPDAAFRFWKANGFKILMTLEPWGGERAKREILDLARYIVTNDYKSCVAGFEFGNETYFYDKYETLAPFWTDIANELTRLWPGVKLGINVGELFELNPDLAHVRNRLLAEGKIDRKTYFSAANFNQYSARFVVAMSNALDKITHVIWHAYGAETPYSCSYHGLKRFRDFAKAFPELKDKHLWLSEIRERSDEDNSCQRMFRETLVMAHYALMTISQPDVDGYNHHQIWAISGGLYQSSGRSWGDQWYDDGGEIEDFRAPYGRPRWEVGHCGVMYRMYTEAVKAHPILLQHGTSHDVGTEDSFYTSARVYDQAHKLRRARKEGKSGAALPQVAGEVEWVATLNPHKNRLCLMMVNTKPTPETVTVRVKGRQFAAPAFRELSCPERFLDCRELPGEGRTWTQRGWEETQSGYTFWVNWMSPPSDLVPDCDELRFEIAPNTVQTVTVVTRARKEGASH